MKRQLLTVIAVLLAAALPGQNVVKNGDFETGFAPWKVSGFMITPKVESFNVTGAGATKAFGWTPSTSAASIEQDITSATSPSSVYELVVDIAVEYPASLALSGPQVSVAVRGFTGGGITLQGFRAPPGSKGDVLRRRLTISDVLALTTTKRSVSITVTNYVKGVFGRTPRVYIDNVVVRARRHPFIGIIGPLTVAGPITMKVKGTPGVNGVVWLSSRLLARPIKIPGLAGELLIDPAVGVPALAGVFDSVSGLLSFQFKNLPPSIAGVRFYLQAVEFNAIRKVAGLGWHQVLTISK
jgi:hypothetical protein